TQELRIPRDLHVRTRLDQRISKLLQLLSSTNRNRRLAENNVLALKQRHQILNNLTNIRQIRRISTLLLRSTHAQEMHLRESRSLRIISSEVQATIFQISLQNLRQTRLKKWDLAVLQRRNLCLIDINTKNLMAKLSHAGRVRSAKVTR